MVDYKKKYEEALEAAKKLQSDWALTQNRAAEEIKNVFPELKPNEAIINHAHLIRNLECSLSGAQEQNDAGCDRSKDIEAYRWGLKVLRLFPHWQIATKGFISNSLYIVKNENEYIITNELRNGDEFANFDNILKIIIP